MIESEFFRVPGNKTVSSPLVDGGPQGDVQPASFEKCTFNSCVVAFYTREQTFQTREQTVDEPLQYQFRLCVAPAKLRPLLPLLDFRLHFFFPGRRVHTSWRKQDIVGKPVVVLEHHCHPKLMKSTTNCTVSRPHDS